jgi:predicted lipoprotein with Yx(FWY)xxD motif
MGFSKSGRRGRLLGHSRGRRFAGLLGVVAVVGAMASLPATAAAVVYYPPTASPAVQTATGFELRGNVYSYGTTTTYHFEYGTTTEYGTSVPMPDAEVTTAGYSSVSEQITGLMPDTTYHWRLVSANSAEGIVRTADQTFSTATTTAPPTTPPTSGGGSGETGTGTKTGTGTGTNPYPGTSNGTSGSTMTPSPTVGGSGPKRVVKTRNVKGKTLLTTTGGRTLYTLSVEKHGKFVCTMESGCTGIWRPLTVASGVNPEGPVKLGTIHRPEGTIQVTYRGLPLYTFASDKKAGQVKGEGLKDVGVWHAATVPAPKPSR